jgi:eight-cysteine-cluster-containing protein
MFRLPVVLACLILVCGCISQGDETTKTTVKVNGGEQIKPTTTMGVKATTTTQRITTTTHAPSTTTTVEGGSTSSGAGRFCGGTAGITCGAGFRCKLDGSYPDAEGICVNDSCPDSCPMYAPPPPGWCSDGKIVGQGLSDCGCPLPPRCEKEDSAIECSSDTDCGSGGCSGQVCAAKDNAAGAITTCEWKPEYDCLKETSCGCVSGKCAWKETNGYKRCLMKVGIRLGMM